MKQLLTFLLILLGFCAAGQTKIKINTLSGQEFSCLLREVAYVKFRSNYAYIISQNNEQLFRILLSDEKYQTIVFCRDENSDDDFENFPDYPVDEPTQNIPTNIENSISQKAKINLFPNPTSQIIRISNAGENPEYKIISLNGVIVQKGKGDEIDLSNFALGTYIIVINNQAFKIIKQ